MNNKEIGNTLLQILDKVTKMEKALSKPAQRASAASVDAVLRERLDRLTIKRHAVLTATLGGVSYQTLAQTMQCDVTTVKLHLKAAITALGISTRSILLASHIKILDSIEDGKYKQRYGISKKWWLENNEQLMSVLTNTKPTHNQYTGASP